MEDYPNTPETETNFEDVLTVKDLLEYINKNNVSTDTKLGFVRISDRYFENNFKVLYMQDGIETEQCVPSDGIYHQNNFLILSVT